MMMMMMKWEMTASKTWSEMAVERTKTRFASKRSDKTRAASSGGYECPLLRALRSLLTLQS
jgi:hypothetical protein